MCESNKQLEKGFATKAIHAGQDHKQWSNSEIVPPIVTTTTYYQEDPTLHHVNYTYGRDGNPTRTALEKCMAELDNGRFCLAFPSGCSAMTNILHLFKSGDHIIVGLETYGGIRVLFEHYCSLQGIQLDFIDATDSLLIETAIKSNTKLIWIETPSNPCLKVSDIAAVSKMAHSRKDAKILVGIDNSILTSYFQKPLDLDADIVMYSVTKFMNGHNDVTMGAVVLNDEELYDELAKIQIKCGSVPSPFDCYLTHRALKTLPLRMDRHSSNSLAIAKYLVEHPKVVKVHYPGLVSHPQYELSQKQSCGFSGLMSFQIDGTVNESKKFVQNLKIIASAFSLGCVESLVMLPYFISHKNVPQEVREKLGIFDTTIRLSVGLENVRDLIQDLEQAFEATYE